MKSSSTDWLGFNGFGIVGSQQHGLDWIALSYFV